MVISILREMKEQLAAKLDYIKRMFLKRYGLTMGHLPDNVLYGENVKRLYGMLQGPVTLMYEDRWNRPSLPSAMCSYFRFRSTYYLLFGVIQTKKI